MPASSRLELSNLIEAVELPQATGFADFIRIGDAGGPLPCWGAITERFDQDFSTTDERTALWATIVEARDIRAQILFLHVNRARPEVMAQIISDAPRLPRLVQRALVSIDELAELIGDHLDRLDPAARQLWEAGPEPRARERELFEARVAELMAFRYFVSGSDADSDDPDGGAGS